MRVIGMAFKEGFDTLDAGGIWRLGDPVAAR